MLKSMGIFLCATLTEPVYREEPYLMPSDNHGPDIFRASKTGNLLIMLNLGMTSTIIVYCVDSACYLSLAHLVKSYGCTGSVLKEFEMRIIKSTLLKM